MVDGLVRPAGAYDPRCPHCGEANAQSLLRCAPPVVRLIVDYTPATGVTEVKFTGGGQQLAANVMLDVVGQLVDAMILKPDSPHTSLEVVRGVVKFQLNVANQLIGQALKPGDPRVERIQKPITLVGT